MEAVRNILRVHGYSDATDLEVGDSVEIELDNDAQMPLVIEKIGEHRLSVAHYYTQMGDLMSDPEIVFRTDGTTWTPVRYTQHPHVERYDPDGLDMAGFVKRWDRNLREQGYVDAAGTTDST